MAEAFGIACHELVSIDFRCGSTSDIPNLAQNVRSWGKSGHGAEVVGTSAYSHERKSGCAKMRAIPHMASPSAPWPNRRSPIGSWSTVCNRRARYLP